jgi:hypothetical protein
MVPGGQTMSLAGWGIGDLFQVCRGGGKAVKRKDWEEVVESSSCIIFGYIIMVCVLGRVKQG